MKRTILHFDMDAFYASVEIRDNPKLKNKPLAIGGGVVSTASYEARKYGIHSAMNTVEAKRLCPNLIILRGDKNKYAKNSQYIHSLVEKVSDKVEYIALDEGFIDITEIIKNYSSKEYFAKKFKERIYINTGLTCSIGIGYNKLTAKIASDINKPNGFYIFNNEDEFMDYIKEKEIKIIPGVGKKLFSQLNKNKIVKTKDVYKFSLRELTALYGIARGSLLYYYSRGIDDRPVKKEKKSISIGNENTYKFPLTTDEELEREYTEIFEKTYRRLKEKEYLCNSVGIKIRYSDFVTITRSKNLSSPTDNKLDLFVVTQELIEKITSEKEIRLVGVSFSQLVKKDKVNRQLSFSF